ncbi:hypothetical protein Tco_0659344 [Tanacetum coccineum]
MTVIRSASSLWVAVLSVRWAHAISWKSNSSYAQKQSILPTWYTQIDINHAAGGNLKGLSAKEAWETIEDCAQCDKCWVLEDFTTYCCWFNIGAASEDLVLLRKIEENRLSF